MTYSKELQIGKAAEHLVVADLLLQGYPAFLADAGSPFDIVVQAHGRLWTIQVKSTQKLKCTRRAGKPSYWFAFRSGKGRRQCTANGIDFFACVALDERHIAYFTQAQLTTSGKLVQGINVYSPKLPSVRTYPSGKQRIYTVRSIDQFPFKRALEATCTI